MTGRTIVTHPLRSVFTDVSGSYALSVEIHSQVIVTHSLLSSHEFHEYERTLAHSLYWRATIATALDDSAVLTYSRDAVDSWQRLYDARPVAFDFGILLQALTLYDCNLSLRDQFDESLDCSQQILLLLRMTPDFEPDGFPTLTWSASGEADVVFSSSRSITRPLNVAFTEASCLWNLGKSLVMLGRYADARVAAMDAVSCLQACLTCFPESQIGGDVLVEWRSTIPRWNSIPRTPVDLSQTDFNTGPRAESIAESG
ncbi:hypothetical protein HGRIS_000709 [Hohenbuehelia grisea]|uniref:Uncharacterized protein n=1 Tax=Hohenbuehelia grisea TaxID=104357 RepID=A0ABR3JSE7_9AGAR